MKKQSSDWEKIITNETTDKGLTSKIYKQLMQLIARKASNPIKKLTEDLNRHFSKDIQMANKHVKKCPISLNREVQIKATNRQYLTPIKMTIFKKYAINKCWREHGEKVMLSLCWWDCKLIQLLWKMVWIFLKKLGIKPPYDPAIPLLGMYPKITKIEIDTCNPMLIAALLQ